MFVAKKGDKWFPFLMDGGPAPEVALSNAKALDTDLKQTRAIFLSHGHSRSMKALGDRCQTPRTGDGIEL